MAGLGYRYSPPNPPSGPIPPRVHPSPHTRTAGTNTRTDVLPDMAVGLKSVAQLTLGPYFSDLRELTEVYNLPEIGNR